MTYEQAKEWLQEWGELCRKYGTRVGVYNDGERYIEVVGNLTGGPTGVYWDGRIEQLEWDYNAPEEGVLKRI